MIGVIAPVGLLFGCVGHHGDATSPDYVRDKVRIPSDEEVRLSYNEFRYRLLCPDAENCNTALWRKEPWVGHTSVGKCAPVQRSGAVRCKFIVFETMPLESDGPAGDLPTGFAEKMHFCAGLFRSNQGEWRMLTLYGKCYPNGEAAAS